MEGALMGIKAQGNLPSTAEEASLLHGHRISMCLHELGAWPCEVVNSSNMAMDQSIGQPVSTEGHSRVVSGGHVHASSHGGEGT